MYIPMNLEILSPPTLEIALQLKEDYGTELKVLAAGTDVLVQIRNGLLKSPRLLNLLNVKGEISAIEEQSNSVNIGALVTHKRIETSPIIQKYAPTLASGSAYIGSPQIRNRGTIGGNVCNASPAGDTIPPLFVHNAEVVAVSIDGSRTIPMTKLFAGPLEIALEPNEILSHFCIPKETGFEWFLERLSQRKALACNKVSVAGVVWRKGLSIDKIRLAFGAVSPIVQRASKTEQFFLKHEFNRESIEQAAEIIATEVNPIDDFRSSRMYRQDMTGQLLKKSLRSLLQKDY
ncbi:MAG: FAD binding domain-containing protein [Candidatus Hodarchaeales archaeon]|jgi:CO/xanthine dehydrogenase FAD-binding subunit